MINNTLSARAHARFERFKARNEGTTALEFAMVAGPFFFLLFGLIEICLVFIVATVMEQAAEDASRTIRTGAFTGTDGVPLQADICTGMIQLFNCGAALRVQVDSPDTFANVPPLNFTEPDGTFSPQASVPFDTGNGGDIVVVRVLFEWQLITPVLSRSLANFGTDTRLIQSTVVFRNEPF
ncbi:MAG: TadE/TadG family type IV pilus assembly protein [Pseudomonadota bacterium]